jgi:uncharacterized metal-binding protein YceD (DUF177 family)
MAETPLFVIPVADLDYGDRDLDEPIPVEWLEKALSETEAVPRGIPGRLEVTVSKSGREVMVRGHARAGVTMPCARTLDPVAVDVQAEVFLLLRPGPAPAGAPPKPERSKRKAAGEAAAPDASPQAAVKQDPRRGPKRREKSREREDEKVLSETEAAEDTYDGEKVVLDAFIKEFLVLELPMFPLREDLRSEATPAIERPPEKAGEVRPGPEAIDPRLAPLAAIRSRLRDKKE